MKRYACYPAMLLLVTTGTAVGVEQHTPVNKFQEKETEMAITDFTIHDMRLEAEALILEQSLLSWKNRVYGEEMDIARTYEGHENLFSIDTINRVRATRDRCTDARERKALEYFTRYLLAEHIGMATARLDDEIRNTESGAEVELEGQTVPYRQLYSLLAEEDDYDRRQRISEAQLPVLKKLEPAYLEKERMSRKLAVTLGFDSYNALGEELRSFSIDKLAGQCEAILSGTEKEYHALLERVVPAFMKMPREKLRRCDILKLFRMDRYLEYFPRKKLLPGVTATLRGMGIALEKQENILIHDRPLPRKNPRAACYAMKVPEQVRLTVKPTGGVSDYETLLHEMGHAQHFAHTRNDVFEFRKLGDNTVTEAHAFLLEELVDNRRWVEKYIPLPPEEIAHYLEFRKFARIYIVRRYAAKLLYEKEFHAGKENPRELYRTLMSRAYGFALDENDAQRYLADVDDFYYVADYLRAWFLKAQMEKKLVGQFGETWFSNPEAGEFLISLWRYGQELNGDELARKLGYKELSPEMLIETIAGGTQFWTDGTANREVGPPGAVIDKQGQIEN